MGRSMSHARLISGGCRPSSSSGHAVAVQLVSASSLFVELLKHKDWIEWASFRHPIADEAVFAPEEEPFVRQHGRCPARIAQAGNLEP